MEEMGDKIHCLRSVQQLIPSSTKTTKLETSAVQLKKNPVGVFLKLVFLVTFPPLQLTKETLSWETQRGN